LRPDLVVIILERRCQWRRLCAFGFGTKFGVVRWPALPRGIAHGSVTRGTRAM